MVSISVSIFGLKGVMISRTLVVTVVVLAVFTSSKKIQSPTVINVKMESSKISRSVSRSLFIV